MPRELHIDAAENPWDDLEKYPASFDIDELRCIYYGMANWPHATPRDGLAPGEVLSVYDVTIEKKPM